MNKENNNANKFTYQFSYVFKINDNVHVTRDFNVKDYNDKFRESYEANELMLEIMGDGSARCNGFTGIIPSALKEKSIQKVWRDSKFQYFDEEHDVNPTSTLSFEIKKRIGGEKEVILATQFETNSFQASVLKYADIREKLPVIMETIKASMSATSYTTTYSGVTLDRYNKITKKKLNSVMNEHK